MNTAVFITDFILASFCCVSFLYTVFMRIPGKIFSAALALSLTFLSFVARLPELKPDSIGSRIIIILSFISLVLTAAELIYLIRLRRNSISPASIREALDLADTGLCYFTGTGRVIMCNSQMNRISRELQGTNVLNGLEFVETIKKAVPLSARTSGPATLSLSDGSVYKLSLKKMSVRGEVCSELLAVEVTELIEKNRLLESENRRIDLMNAEIREYGVLMDGLIREREILNAKIRIHDNFGDLLLSTQKIIAEGSESETEGLTQKWENCLDFLSVKDNRDGTDEVSELINTAEKINVDLVFNGELPSYGSLNEITILAVRECLTNAVKYADSHRIYINMSQNGKIFLLSIKNDGNPPQGEIKEGGGLSMLRRKVKLCGGTMKIDSLPEFLLSITLPITEEKNFETL